MLFQSVNAFFIETAVMLKIQFMYKVKFGIRNDNKNKTHNKTSDTHNCRGAGSVYIRVTFNQISSQANQEK